MVKFIKMRNKNVHISWHFTLRILFAAFLFVCFTSNPSIAAYTGAFLWPDNGPTDKDVNVSSTTTDIKTVNDGESNVTILADGSGGAIFCWRQAMDIYAQRIDRNGVPQWLSGGVPICVASGTQAYPYIAADGDGGAVIAWYDNRNSFGQIYAQRIDNAGLLRWTSNGVKLSSNTIFSNVSGPAVTNVGNKNTIICWGSSGVTREVVAQKLDENGNLLWDPAGVVISKINSASEWSVPRLISDGSGGAILGYTLSIAINNLNIYAQRVDSSGILQWPTITATADVAVCTASNRQTTVNMDSDGSGGAVIAWNDARSGTSADVYVNRVAYNGVPQWSADGNAVITGAGDQILESCISDGKGGALVLYRDVNAKTLTVKRYDSVGNWQWTKLVTNPVPSVLNNIATPKLALAGSEEGFYVVYSMSPSGSLSQTFISNYTKDGALRWTKSYDKLTGYSLGYYGMVPDGYGGAIYNYLTTDTSTYIIKGQRVVNDAKAPTLEVLAPKGSGLAYEQGDTINIRWRAIDDFAVPTADCVALSYTLNSGINWTVIPTLEENDISSTEGSYIWALPAITGTCRISIDATDTASNHGYAISDAFTVNSGLLSEIYVSPSGSDTYPAGTGSSSKPYKTFQKALNRSAVGGVIKAYGGIYNEYDIQWPNKNNISIKRAVTTDMPIIDAQTLGRAINCPYSVNATIEGITIQNGRVTANGGAINLTGTSSSKVKFKTVYFLSNQSLGASNRGGAVYSSGMAAIYLDNCYFVANKAEDYSGAVFGAASTIYAYNCVFVSNEASSGGVTSGNLHAENCKFSGNNATTGGGIKFGSGNLRAINCIFYGNTAGLYGGVVQSSSFFVFNSIFARNNSPLGPVFNAGTTIMTYSCVQPNEVYTGTGNISASIEFISEDWQSPDFLRPKPFEKCIDAGTANSAYDSFSSSSYFPPNTDYDGIARPGGTTGNYDMGALERTGTPKVHNKTNGLNYYTIYSAMKNAGTGHVISVEAGTFYEHDILWPNANNVILIGSGPDVTIISAEGRGRAIAILNPLVSTISSLTIRNGLPNRLSTGAAPGRNGGGIHYSAAPATPGSCTLSVINCNFYGNSAGDDPAGGGGHGGGICAINNQLFVRDSLMSENKAGNGGSAVGGNGGGVYCSSNGIITNCSFIGNLAGDASSTAAGSGGGLAVTGTANTVDNCKFIRNKAGKSTGGNGGLGGAAHMTGTTTITNSIFASNEAGEGTVTSGGGGAIYFGGSGNINVYFCDLFSNLTRNSGSGTQSSGGGVYFASGTNNITNSILWGNTAQQSIYNQIYLASGTVAVTYSDVQGSLWPGASNKNVDPLFLSADDSSPFYLLPGPGSPCINSGVYISTIPLDFLGNARLYPPGGQSDMGVYEIQANKPVISRSSITINGSPLTSRSYVPVRPTIKATINDQYISFGTPSIEVQIGPKRYVVVPDSIIGNDFTITCASDIDLTEGSHTIEILVKNVYNESDQFINSKMSLTSLQSVVGKLKNVPNPFKPKSGIGTTFVYNLSSDADVKLIVYDITGKRIWQKICMAGTEGGRVNENKVYWNGETDLGQTLANGAYYYVITRGSKIMAKGQFAVAD